MSRARKKKGTLGRAASSAREHTQPLSIAQLEAMERGIERRIKQWQDDARAKKGTSGHCGEAATGGGAPLATQAPRPGNNSKSGTIMGHCEPAPANAPGSGAPLATQAPEPDTRAKSGTIMGHREPAPTNVTGGCASLATQAPAFAQSPTSNQVAATPPLSDISQISTPAAEPNTDLQHLSSDQKRQIAFEGLLLGKSVQVVATELGVDRRTIARWKQRPEFQAAFRDCQSQHGDRLFQAMAGFGPVAINILTDSLKNMNVNTAMKLVKSLALADLSPFVDAADSAPTPPEQVAATFAAVSSTTSTAELAAPGIAPPAGERPEGETTIGETQACETPVCETPDTVETRILPDPPDLSDLTPPQQTVLMALLEGETSEQAAAGAAVTAREVQQWVAHDTLFQRVFTACRKSRLLGLRGRVLQLVARAVAVIKHALFHHRDVRVALFVLKTIKVLR